MLAAAAALCLALSSCDDYIYDYEGDCSVTYRLEFRYDKNMKWADAFSQEVRSVRLYAFDTDGELVWQKSESGGALSNDGYAMRLDLPAGSYRLLAWCGLDNASRAAESFSVPEAVIGETRIEELRCRMNRLHDETGAYSSEHLSPLFHGMIDVNLPASEDKAEITDTMNLTKDTNHIRIILQHLSGEKVDVGDFNFRIEEENGLMDYDNSLMADEMITYRPYSTSSATADESVSVAVADIAIARLTEDRKTYLTIDTEDGELVAKIPLTDYALILKDGYEHEMTDQDYLDRQDEYALTFFLDQNNKWINTSIIINSWRVVLNDMAFNSI